MSNDPKTTHYPAGVLVALAVLAAVAAAIARSCRAVVRRVGQAVVNAPGLGALVVLLPLLVVSGGTEFAIAGCASWTAQDKALVAAAEGAGLSLAAGSCTTYLPQAAPGLGPYDVLLCKGAESLLSGLLTAVGAPAPATVGQSSVLAWHAVTYKGATVLLVRTTPDRAAKAQAWADAQAKGGAL